MVKYFSKTGKEVSRTYLMGQPGVSHVMNIDYASGTRTETLELECSSDGDINFSAFGARVEVYGVEDTIEYHYQTAKMIPKLDAFDNVVFDNVTEEPILVPAKNVVQGKGFNPSKIKIGGLVLDGEFKTQWYKLLWVKYLDQNPELVAYLNNFDKFTDRYAKAGGVSQAAVIYQYIKKGRESIMEDCEVLFHILTQQNRINKQYEEEHQE